VVQDGLFLFHVFNMRACMYGIYKGFSRNSITSHVVPRITRKISDEMQARILDVQFVTHFCVNASKVCFCCLYFKLVTVFTYLCPGLRSRGQII